MDSRTVLLMIICGSSIVKGECHYDSVTAKCFCNSHIDIIEKVMLVEIQSETCNCTISFLNNMDTPLITNIYDRSCKWNCTSTICMPINTATTKDPTESDTTITKPKTTKPTTINRDTTKIPDKVQSRSPPTTTTTQTTEPDMPAPTTETSHTTTQTTEPDKSAPTTETRQTTEPDMSAPTTETSQTTTRQTTEPNMSAPTTETSQTTRRQITEPDMSAPTTQTSPTTVMKATVTGLWIWVAILSCLTVAAFIRLFLQLRKQQSQYLPLHRSLNSTVSTDPYTSSDNPIRQSSYLSMSQTSTQRSFDTPEPFIPDISTPPASSSPLPYPALLFSDREESPEPSTPPIEMMQPSSPISGRTKSKTKKKIKFEESFV